MASHAIARAQLGRWLAAFLLVLGLAGCGVNEIPSREERAKAAWGEVENQYQRRADLIPNLVETVKGYAAHEKDVLEGVVKARAAAVTQLGRDPKSLNDPAKFKEYEQRQIGTVRRARATARHRRELSRPQGQSELPGACSRSSRAPRTGSRWRGATTSRRSRHYNTELRTFPGRIWAMVLYRDAQPMPVFSAAPGSQDAPKVNFGG